MPLAGALTLSDRTVDLPSGRMSTGGQLRPLEVRVLQLLAANLGQTVSTERILVEALGYAATTRSHTLYTTVHRLRSAIEADPTRPRHVVARRSEGYELVQASLTVALEAPPSNLVAETDRFVGREAELARLDGLDVPLVTVIGPGGAGKTRLALHLAGSRALPGGSWLVPLADHPPDRFAEAVLDAVAPPETRDRGLDLAARIRASGRCRLVLDGVEHAVEGCRAVVRAIRAGAPEARLVVTSRVPLGIAGEHLVEVGPLERVDAISLLVARATEAGFRPSDDDRVGIEALADRLDRLPLALELAAGHLGTFPPATVLARLEAHGDLRSTREDREPRHRSLDQVFGSTWSLLDDADRRSATSLAVLDGPFGVAVAEAVLDDLDAASILVRLHRRGMVAAAQVRGRSFSMLRTVRDAIRARTSPDEREQALARVDRFVRERAEERVRPDGLPAWFDGDQSDDATLASLRRCGIEEPRIAAAAGEVLRRRAAHAERLEVAQGALGRAGSDWSPRLRIELALAESDLGRPVDARWTSILDDADSPPLLQAYAALKLARAALAGGSYDEVDRCLVVLERRLAEVPPGRREWLPGSTRHVRATALQMQGRLDEAAAGFEAASRDYAAVGAGSKAALARVGAGAVAGAAGRWASSVEWLRDGLRALVAQDDDEARFQVGVARMLLGQSLLPLDPSAAEVELERARWVCAANGQVAWELAARAKLAIAAAFRGRLAEALVRVGELRSQGDGGVRITPVSAIWSAELVVLTAAGRFEEGLAVADQAQAHADRFDLVVGRMAVAEPLIELWVGAGRLDRAREVVERLLADLPTHLVPWPDLIVGAAEVRRAQGDRRGALDAVLARCARPLDPPHRWVLHGLRCALSHELGAPGEAIGDVEVRARESPPGDGTLGPWLRVCRARIEGVSGERPEVPLHARVLARAVDELWGSRAC